MALLERIKEMKEKGLSEKNITDRLKEEGISPMEINDAMNQSKIKEAVSGEDSFSTKGMTPSMMGNEEEESANPSGQPAEETYAPSPTPDSSQDYANYSYQEEGNYSPDKAQGGSEEYYEQPENNGYAPNQNYSMNSETMIEVAEQVFSEKTKKIEDDLKTLKEARAIMAPALEDMNERLRRIEKQFDKMQIAILDKVGSFGKNIEAVKKEVEMVEDSFEKLNKNKK